MAAVTRPPGPKGMPIVGSLPEFRKGPLQFLRRVAEEHGDFAFYRMGPYNMYFVNRPDLIRDVLVTHADKFGQGRVVERARMLIGEGLLTSEGQFHLRQRRLVQPAFHRERLAGYSAAMVDCGVRMREAWRPGLPINVQDEMMKLTLNVIARTMFSTEMESEAEEIGQAMAVVLGMFELVLLPFSEYLEYLPIPAMFRFKRAHARLDRTIFGMIRERRASGLDRGDLLSMLLLAQDDQGDGGTMTDQQVRDEALTIFLAGHETTANALTWTWYLLSQHPEVEAKLHAELDTVLAGRTPGLDDIPHLRYTEMVLSEVMRLYPPAWAIGRRVMKDLSIDGHGIPTGSLVIISPYVLHRHPRYYPDPDRFDPERWTPEAREARPKDSYLPFSTGVRRCIGERFAWMEGVLLIATLAQKWRLHLLPGQVIEPRPLITLRMKYGLKMEAVQRSESPFRFTG